MQTLRSLFRSRLLIELVIGFSTSPATAQPTPQKASQPPAPIVRKLTGNDAKHAEELETAIDAAVHADRWDEAIAKAEQLLALRTQAQGLKHFETVNAEWNLKALRRVAPLPKEDRAAYRSAIAMNGQGASLYAAGNCAAAQPVFQRSLETTRRLLTDDHPATAARYAWLAESFKAQGKSTQAQPLYKKALEIHRRLLGDDHPDTAISYANVGSNLEALGKHAEAQPFCEKALQIHRRLLTDNHSYTAISYGRLAMNLNSQGKYAPAQPLFEKALEISRRLFGDDHAATAYGSLAYNLKCQGKYVQAQALYEKALDIFRRVLTDDHPDTALCYNNLASDLDDQGKHAQAHPLYEKALEIHRRVLTDNHPRTAMSYNNLAMNLEDQGKYAQAQPLYEKALDIRRRLLADDHPDTGISYGNLGCNLEAQGNFAAAQPLLERALQIHRHLLTDNHPYTAQGYNNLAHNLYKQRKYAQAQGLFEKALQIRRRLLTDNHPATAVGWYNLAFNLCAQGKYAQAQPLFENALEIRRRLLTDNHSQTAQSYNYLAANLSAQGKYAEAKDLWLRAARSQDAARLRRAFTGLERSGGGEDSARAALAAVQARLGQPAEAWQSLEEDLGRGLLEELLARQDRRLTAAERDRIHQLTTHLERLDKLVESMPKELDNAERAKRFDELKHQRELASIALGELQTKLDQRYGPLAGQVAELSEIQAALPPHAALIAWVDLPPMGPHAADPDGEHWGVVVRSRGIPAWIPIGGTGKDGLWTKDDTGLANRVRTALRARPGAGAEDWGPVLHQLRTQRLAPLAKALDATTDGQPPARRLVVLPSHAMAGIPIEALLAPDDTWTVSYAPSATVFKHLREQPRTDRRAGLLALAIRSTSIPTSQSTPSRCPITA